MTILEQLESLIFLSQKILDKLADADWEEVSRHAAKRNADCKELFNFSNYAELSQYPDILNNLARLDQQILLVVDKSKTATMQQLSHSKLKKVANIAYLDHSF